MKILLIGGTVFLGRHIVEAALERGHEVTLFNRGQHNPELFPQAEKLRGNRDGDLEALQGRRWDAVVDTCGYFPRLVEASARLLADAVERYVFISSISVYADPIAPGSDETAPVARLKGELVEQITGESYGALKALCEQAAEAAVPGRTLVIRPGLIVGPHDVSDRFTYWPVRIARGGDVLAPNVPDMPVQIIDVRDLARWTVHMVEQKAVGTYNATGPDYRLTFKAVLDECMAVASGGASLTWVDEDFLLERKVGPWMEVPLWIPHGEGDGMSSVSIARATADGLTFRSLTETVRDTLAWDASRPADVQRRAGLNPEREQELLAEWFDRG